jgi:hypothetical protein
MLTKLDDGAHPTFDKYTLAMSVSGNSFAALVNLVKGVKAVRPLSLNLLGNILDEMKARQGMGIHPLMAGFHPLTDVFHTVMAV